MGARRPDRPTSIRAPAAPTCGRLSPSPAPPRPWWVGCRRAGTASNPRRLDGVSTGAPEIAGRETCPELLLGMPNSRTPTLAVVVPADRSAADARPCLAALRASTRAARRADRGLRAGRRGPGGGPQRAVWPRERRADRVRRRRRPRSIPTPWSGSGALRRGPRPAALFGSYDDMPAAPGAVSQFRNLLHHHVHSPIAGPGRDLLGGARRHSPRAPSSEPAGSTPRASPRRRSRTSSSACACARAGARDRPRPRVCAARTSSAGRCASMVRDRFRAAAAFRGCGCSSSRLGSTALQPLAAHRLAALASVGRVAAALARGGRARRSPRWRRAVRSTAPFYRVARAPRWARGWRSPGSPCTSLHHLTAVAAVPVGAAQHLLAGRSPG